MARFYLHLHNRVGTVRDEEGQELPDLRAAREVAITSIRSIIADEAQHGRIDLAGFVRITDGDERDLARIRFGDAFELLLDGAA